MRNLSVRKKIYVPMLVLFSLMILAMFLFLQKDVAVIEKQVLQEKAKEFEQFAQEKLDAKYQIAITNAINVAQNKFVIDGLKSGDKSLVKSELSNLAENIKATSDYKNIQIHVHTADIVSFIRSWNNKSGDDLSSFRFMIHAVKKSKKPVLGIEVGRTGMVIRGIAPIFNDYDKSYMGSVEFIQSFESIVKSLKKQMNTSVVIAMDTSLLDVANGLKDNAKIIQGKYVVAQKPDNVDKAFVAELSGVSKDKLVGYFNTDNFFVTKIPLKDYEGKQIGQIFVGAKNAEIYQAVSTAKAGMIGQITVAIIAVILTIIILMIVLKIYLVNPVDELRAHARELSRGEGDLTKKLPVSSDDEIGQTAQEFNALISKIHEIISLAKDTSNENASIANELSSTSKVVSNSVENTSATIENTFNMSTSIKEELKKSIENVKTTSQELKNSSQKLYIARDNISKISKSILDASVSENELASRMKQLSSETQQIKDVLGVISDIADQTNLLALNAAIEAARAGEHGRGFAVVADGVRKLAEGTQNSINQINVTINTIVQAITSATDSMEENSENISALIDVANNAETAVVEAADGMNVCENKSEIAEKDFVKTNEDINLVLEKIKEINEISSTNMRNTEEIAAASEHLYSMGEKLNEILVRFRT
ncbi:MAG: methyl-accepting chemotaxis protein [Campylobacter sp.]|nr:methyl-accepting chemotaxis protein [Campylobacter sp.]